MIPEWRNWQRARLLIGRLRVRVSLWEDLFFENTKGQWSERGASGIEPETSRTVPMRENAIKQACFDL